MIRVLLSLDLKGSEDKRDDLYEVLADKNWHKTDHIDTVWTLGYEQYDHENEEAFTKIKRNIATTMRVAAENLEIKKISYVAQLGNKLVIARVVQKVDGVYKVQNQNLYKKKK